MNTNGLTEDVSRDTGGKQLLRLCTADLHKPGLTQALPRWFKPRKARLEIALLVWALERSPGVYNRGPTPLCHVGGGRGREPFTGHRARVWSLHRAGTVLSEGHGRSGWERNDFPAALRPLRAR